MDANNSRNEQRNAIRASLACVQCRSRHLRCDGLKPLCSRCKEDGSVCAYMKSRRGGRKRATAPIPTMPTPETSIPAQRGDSGLWSEPTTPPTAPVIGSHSSLASSHSSPTGGSPFPIGPSDSHDPSERVLALYYQFFHRAHPCVLPLRFLLPYRSNEAPGVHLLIYVLQYIGSIYTSRISSEPYQQQVEIAIRNLLPTSSLFEVQALLLYSIAAQWNNQLEYSDSLINLAIDKALALGMNNASFATQKAARQSVYAESCRRTWWQLYLCEMSMCAIDRKPTFRLNLRVCLATTELPCSEEEFNEGRIPLPRTLEEWDQREFSDEPDTDFSSQTYFIGLYRTLDFSLWGARCETEVDFKRICTCADAGIGAFHSFCAATKRQLINDNGKLDSFIFRANMGIVVYTAQFHRFLSTIVYHPAEAISTCGPPPPPEKLAPKYVQEAPVHTAKILKSTELLTDLLTTPMDLLTQSPMTVCMIASSTIALISACKSALQGEEITSARERIRVSIAAIDKFSPMWPRALTTSKQVKAIAREIFAIGKPQNSQTDASPDARALPSFNIGNVNQFSIPPDLMATSAAYDMENFGFTMDANGASSNDELSTDGLQLPCWV